jgi:AbrB family looped-hinge helix DNA binding protein
MEKVKVTRKYQVTIPRKIREKVGIKVGDELIISNNGQTVTLEKPIDLEALAGSWTHIESTAKFMEETRELWKTWKMK